MRAHSTATAIPPPAPAVQAGAIEEHDVVKLVTDAYAKDGYKSGEEGTVINVYTDKGGKADGWVMVEFDYTKHDDTASGILDLRQGEVELVWKNATG